MVVEFSAGVGCVSYVQNVQTSSILFHQNKNEIVTLKVLVKCTFDDDCYDFV